MIIIPRSYYVVIAYWAFFSSPSPDFCLRFKETRG